jgi:hypothetical protein
VDEAKEILFGDDTSKKSITKKILDDMKAKGSIKVKSSLGNRFVINSEK